MSESNYKSVITKPPTKNNQPFKKKGQRKQKRNKTKHFEGQIEGESQNNYIID